ncbi:MAG: phosphoribosylformylglycinamidine synthase subunit PurL [Sulfolobales archaeon]
MTLSSDELSEIRSILGREPTDAELLMFEAQWSEHCSYKSSRHYLKLLPSEGVDVLIGPGRDAAAVRVFRDFAVVLKIESHNHPSAVDPYNGASTGVGGVVRDILTLGAKPIALLDLLFFGNPRDKHANWLIKGVVRGISDYGNRIGVPVVSGMVWFDESYNKYPLVNVACIGIVEISKIINGVPEDGDYIVIIGNTTGRDGILGSSFASKPLDLQEDSSYLPAIQVGNPLIEKLIIDFLVEAAELRILKHVKDLGGGGLATAIAELTSNYGLGAYILLERLHTREPDLRPEEMLVSESQERMLLVVSREDFRKVEELLSKYNLQYSVVGYLDRSGLIKVYYNSKLVACIPADKLARPQVRFRSVEIPEHYIKLHNNDNLVLPEVKNLNEVMLKLLSSPNIASKEWIYSQYDYEVGVRTVVKPGFGDAAVLRLIDVDGRVGIAVKGDGNPRYVFLNPFRGAANAVAECYRNLISVGSKPIAIVDELNAGNPEKPTHYWYFTEMVKGISWCASELKLPVVGGKVSFYNEDLSRGVMVKPVATIVGVGVIDDIAKSLTFELKREGNYVLVVGTTYPELGGSEYLHSCLGLELGEVPLPRPSTEVFNGEYISKLVELGYVEAVHDIDIGGLAVAIAEMCITGMNGARLDLRRLPSRGCSRVEELLFSETQARYLVEVKRDVVDSVLELATHYGVDVGVLGEVGGDSLVLTWGDSKIINVSLDELREAYMNSLEFLMSW